MSSKFWTLSQIPEEMRRASRSRRWDEG